MLRFYEDCLERLGALHTAVERAIEGLPVAALDWVPGPDMNSLAVLIVHLAGAERYWVGDVAGSLPSNRDREAEFRVRGLDEPALRRRLADTFDVSREVLSSLRLEDLEAERTSERDGRSVTVGWALAHALEHDGLHVGHIQIVRQLLEQHREAWYTFTAPEDK